MWGLYKNLPSFVLGFHGCDAAVAAKVIAGTEQLRISKKEYDWLGSGAYFWEGSPHRAMEWAENMAARPSTSPNRIQTPAVVGAVIDLGLCFNLFDSAALEELRVAWRSLAVAAKKSGGALPKNIGGTPDKLGRFRDRAVIEWVHMLRIEQGLPAYDSVRAAFPEGGQLYPGAGFTARSHIQIAVVKPTCIKGFFNPIAQAEDPA